MRYGVQFSRNQLWMFLGGGLFLIWPMILVEVFPQVSISTLPSFQNLLPGLFAWFVFSKIQSPYARLLCYVWLIWYCVGTLNTIASSLVLGSYYSNLDLHLATQIFFWACVFYFLGLLTFERWAAPKGAEIYGVQLSVAKLHPLTAFVILVFPFLWLGSMYVSIGYIPILMGVNIVDEMYELNYGPLYGYGSCIVFSIIHTGYLALVVPTNSKRIIFMALTLMFLLISMADGKRAFAMVSIAALLGISFRVMKEKTWSRTLPIFAYTMIAMYVGTLLLRSGDTGSMTTDANTRMMLVGVEFRDFVYTVNFHKPGEIENYSWGVSTFASLINGGLLQVFGFDKSSLTVLDSAHAWAAIWNTTFGIRTGIVSELWFAYGLYGLLVIYLFGLLSGYVIYKVRTLSNVRDVMFLAAIYGVLFLGVTSQSTFTAGVLPVFLYLYVALRVGEHLLSVRKK